MDGLIPGRSVIRHRSLEEWMDADFSDVCIHTGGRTAKATEEIDAKVFCCGNGVVCNSGACDSKSPEGQHLLAHELAHVTQQNSDAPTSMILKEEVNLETDLDSHLGLESDEVAEEALSDGPVTITRMGAEMHIQRSALGKLNPFSNTDEQDSGELVLDEVKAEPEALAEEVRQIKVNQATLFNEVRNEQGLLDAVGEATGKGIVGGGIGLAVTAATANPVFGAMAGGAFSDVAKTLYGNVYERGRDSISEVELDTLAEKVKQRIKGTEYGGEAKFEE
ncbi:eCIS core domain-containing protein [Natrinema limicola]|nr:DUF4157 domain-containing protein [Natrinema limicola]